MRRAPLPHSMPGWSTANRVDAVCRLESGWPRIQSTIRQTCISIAGRKYDQDQTYLSCDPETNQNSSLGGRTGGFKVLLSAFSRRLRNRKSYQDLQQSPQPDRELRGIEFPIRKFTIKAGGKVVLSLNPRDWNRHENLASALPEQSSFPVKSDYSGPPWAVNQFHLRPRCKSLIFKDFSKFDPRTRGPATTRISPVPGKPQVELTA